MNEVWNDVKGYEGLYKVSSLGNVYSLRQNKKMILKDHHGYKRLHLTKNKKQSMVRVHRLVAEAFIPNPENKQTVNHKDSNRANNNVDNLEWFSSIENTRDKVNKLKTIQSLFDSLCPKCKKILEQI